MLGASGVIVVPADASEARLVVTGRVSGQRREVRLWFVLHADRVFVMAGEPHRSQWLRNVQARPDVELEVGGRIWRGLATSVNGGPEDPAVRAAFGAKYGTRYLKRWLAESHPVAIDRLVPVSAAAPAVDDGLP